ncbi:MAG TPA: PAS domain S-box protein [bacterium]|nr:PAS domain S-box protein [bacterium]
MTIDIRTLIFVLGITHLLQFIVFLYQYIIYKPYRGIKWWLLWSVAEIVGFAFLLLREIPAIEKSAIIIQNASIVLGVIFIYIGIMHFFEKKENLRLVLSIYAIFIFFLFYFLFIDNNINIRSFAIAVTLATMSFITIHALLVYRPKSVATTANFIALVFLVHGGFFTFRAIAILLFKTNESVYNSTTMHIAMYTDALVCGLLWTLAFIIMINQHLIADLKEARDEMQLVFNTSPDAAIISRLNDGLIVFANEGFSSLTGYAPNEFMGKTTLDLDIWADPKDRNTVTKELVEKGHVDNFATMFRKKDTSQVNGLMSAKIINLQNGPHIISVTRDISELKNKEQDLISTVASLQKALEEIKTLRGIIPICSYCKKIRDDQGYWSQVESYVSKHSEAQFSHGLCPDCIKKLYPEFYKEK